MIIEGIVIKKNQEEGKKEIVLSYIIEVQSWYFFKQTEETYENKKQDKSNSFQQRCAVILTLTLDILSRFWLKEHQGK
jgi:hypothetical protein